MSITVFPPLPPNLKGKRPALTVNTSSGSLRSANKTGQASDQDNTQQYLDALNADIASIVQLLVAAAVVIPAADNSVTINGVVVTY